MNDDIEAYRRRVVDSLGRYGEVYPSLVRRVKELSESDDPFVRQFIQDVVAAHRRRDDMARAGLIDRYGLTPKEGLIAAHLADGGSVASYAEQHGVSEQTVRSQLKSIFAKTGVNRQAALAALMTARPSGLR